MGEQGARAPERQRVNGTPAPQRRPITMDEFHAWVLPASYCRAKSSMITVGAKRASPTRSITL